ncbi:hypothetical protein [Clostridium chromiireducens]|uniref:Uncharacterized protein n=1 Tax=Clostridium chromiireducens TaxID=225345 RepID=A0A1V4IVF1_9CLOT|nr:hypothetical protein [Clostridium chromiireducens]OPJ63916.1 hypothetical protein CLCHR_14350 [Clostridium chromiireducens]RII35724.1 hypothetical protein D2A34_11185 [Clostridium chromiireducens]
MEKENDRLEIKDSVSIEDKQILRKALDGINGWNFNPVAVVTNGVEEYYFICKVRSVIENLQMEMAKVYIKVQKDNEPRLLAIEEIN